MDSEPRGGAEIARGGAIVEGIDGARAAGDLFAGFRARRFPAPERFGRVEELGEGFAGRNGSGDGEFHAGALEYSGETEEDVVPQAHRRKAGVSKGRVLVVTDDLKHGAARE